MPGFPDYIIICKQEYTYDKGDHRQMFHAILPPKWQAVKMKEFTDHPITVGADPDRYSQVMTKFRYHFPGPPGNNNSDNEGWGDHEYAQEPPIHAPGNILKKPEYNVQVFHPAVPKGDAVNRRTIFHTRI